MSVDETLATIAKGLGSAAEIASKLDKHDNLAEASAEIWKRVRTILRIPPDTDPKKLAPIHRALARALGKPEGNIKTMGHAMTRRPFYANVLLHGSPLAFCRAMIVALAATSAASADEKSDQAHSALRESFQRQIVEMQSNSREKQRVLEPVNVEKMHKLLDDFYEAYQVVAADVDRHFDPNDIATISAKRFLLANTCAPVEGTKIIEDGYYAIPEFWKALRERFGLKSDEDLDPGTFVNEIEKQACIDELEQGIPLHQTTYYPRYSRVMHHILKSRGLEKIKEVLGDRTGGLHGIEMMLNTEATPEDKQEAMKAIRKHGISLVGLISPAALGWDEYEKAHYTNTQGDKVPLELDPGLQKLLA